MESGEGVDLLLLYQKKTHKHHLTQCLSISWQLYRSKVWVDQPSSPLGIFKGKVRFTVEWDLFKLSGGKNCLELIHISVKFSSLSLKWRSPYPMLLLLRNHSQTVESPLWSSSGGLLHLNNRATPSNLWWLVLVVNLAASGINQNPNDCTHLGGIFSLTKQSNIHSLSGLNLPNFHFS